MSFLQIIKCLSGLSAPHSLTHHTGPALGTGYRGTGYSLLVRHHCLAVRTDACFSGAHPASSAFTPFSVLALTPCHSPLAPSPALSPDPGSISLWHNTFLLFIINWLRECTDKTRYLLCAIRYVQ